MSGLGHDSKSSLREDIHLPLKPDQVFSPSPPREFLHTCFSFFPPFLFFSAESHANDHWLHCSQLIGWSGAEAPWPWSPAQWADLSSYFSHVKLAQAKMTARVKSLLFLTHSTEQLAAFPGTRDPPLQPQPKAGGREALSWTRTFFPTGPWTNWSECQMWLPFTKHKIIFPLGEASQVHFVKTKKKTLQGYQIGSKKGVINTPFTSLKLSPALSFASQGLL